MCFLPTLTQLNSGPHSRRADGEQPTALVVTRKDGDGVPVLVIEVSDAPITDYPGDEAGRFAAAGVRDYWVMEVSGSQAARSPRPAPGCRRETRLQLQASASLHAELADFSAGG